MVPLFNEHRLPVEQLASEELHDVLDLCLQCKGCKSECPSQVDMAKMKAEILHQYQKAHGTALRDKLFGHIGQINRLASPFARLFNTMGKTALSAKLMDKIGITNKRTLPELTNERFSRWLKKQPVQEGSQVVLFNDTFNEFNCPEVGIAAVKVLNHMGYQVISPPWACCGRTLISKGLLKPAQNKARKLVQILLPYAKKHIPIIGLEPSCLLTIKDDFQSLLGYDDPDLQTVNAMCQTFDQFIASHDSLPFERSGKPVSLHGHCHQKALVGTQHALKVLGTIAKPREIPTGCCGMAGSFGYEQEHYELSMKIGELKLFPSIRETDDPIIADGFSCRCQIEHGTGRKALHLAEYLLHHVH